MKKRIISLFCALLLLTPGFLLRTRSGRIQYYDYAAGLWHETGASMDGLSAVDRALLARGRTSLPSFRRGRRRWARG